MDLDSAPTLTAIPESDKLSAAIKKEEAKPRWGCSPKDSDELKAKALTQFPNLSSHERRVCIMAACYTIFINDNQKIYSRKKNKEIYREWGSYLNKEELIMIGELDRMEADNLYKESQANSYSYSCFESSALAYSIEAMKHGLPFQDFNLSSYIGKGFVDGALSEFEGQVKKCPHKPQILEDHIRKEMLNGRESYLMLMEEASVMRRYIINKSEEGACSETKFHQSDEQEREEMLEEAAMEEIRFPEFVW